MKKNKFSNKLLLFCFSIAVFLFFCFKAFDVPNVITASSSSSATFPEPTSYKYINDYVGIVNDDDIEKIVSIGKELESKTSAQASIVIVNSTNGIPIEDYTNKLFRTWGIGTKDKDNGLLILLAIDDRAWRVEVGRGLEGAIPDALSNRVMVSLAKPKFASNNYSEGLLEAYSAFSDYIAEDYNVSLDKSLNITVPNSDNESTISSKSITFITIIILLLVFSDFIFNRGRIFSTLLKIFFWSSITNHRSGPFGGSNHHNRNDNNGGFGGGSSNGGGSSGSW